MRGYDDWKLKAPPLYTTPDYADDIDLANYPCSKCGRYIEDGEEYEAEYDDGWILQHLNCPGVA